MSLLPFSLESLTAEHLRALVENRVGESRVLDFKQAYSLAEDDQKRDFARDVVAFANSLGGDLVYGVKESDGVALEIIGVESFAEDQERLRIESLIASAVSPRLRGVGFKTIVLEDATKVFIVRIPRSLSAPHMVMYKNDHKFYGRHSSGKFAMDVNQVRDSFVESETISNKARSFRSNRLAWISEKEVGVRFLFPHVVVLHILPLSSLRGEAIFDGRSASKLDASALRPLSEAGGYSNQLNLDGYRTYSTITGGKVLGYVQLFRNGCLEAVDGAMLPSDNTKMINPYYERTVRDGIHRYLGALRTLGLDGPTLVALSLQDVQGYAIWRHPHSGHAPQTIEAPDLILPEFVVEGGATEDEIDASLRGVFDLVWNACGAAGSGNFDNTGKWKANRS